MNKINLSYFRTGSTNSRKTRRIYKSIKPRKIGPSNKLNKLDLLLLLVNIDIVINNSAKLKFLNI